MRRYLLIRLYLGWHVIAATGFGLELIAAPRELITGQATVTVFALRPPWQWGVAFVAVAVICLAGVRWPRHGWRPAMLALIVVQFCWAIALIAPLLTTGRTNLLAPVPWIALAATSIVIGGYTDLIEERPAANSASRG